MREIAVTDVALTSQDATERLIRVRTTRRGISQELRVHYEILRGSGCDTIRLFSVEDAD
jgi:hypothetical protein